METCTVLSYFFVRTRSDLHHEAVYVWFSTNAVERSILCIYYIAVHSWSLVYIRHLAVLWMKTMTHQLANNGKVFTNTWAITLYGNINRFKDDGTPHWKLETLNNNKNNKKIKIRYSFDTKSTYLHVLTTVQNQYILAWRHTCWLQNDYVSY